MIHVEVALYAALLNPALELLQNTSLICRPLYLEIQPFFIVL